MVRPVLVKCAPCLSTNKIPSITINPNGFHTDSIYNNDHNANNSKQ